MSKQKEEQKKEGVQTLDNPDVIVVLEAEAPKLAGRDGSNIEYQVGRIGRDVFIRIAKNHGGGSFSKEWVQLDKIRAAITPEMRGGQPFRCDVLSSAITGRSQCNVGFVTASLRHLGIFSADAEHKGMSIVTGDLDTWERQMRDAEPVLGDDGQPVTVKLRPEPKETRFRKAEPAEGPTHAEGEVPPQPQDDTPQGEDAKPKKRGVRISKSAAERLGLAHVASPEAEAASEEIGETPVE